MRSAPRDPRTRAEIEAEFRGRVAEIAALFGAEIVEEAESSWGICDPAWDESGERYYYVLSVRTAYVSFGQVVDDVWPMLEGDGWRSVDDRHDLSKIVLIRGDQRIGLDLSGLATGYDVVKVRESIGCVRPADY